MSRPDVTRDAQRLLDAMGRVPIGLLDLVRAKPAQPRHVRHADGHVGIDQITEAARFGIVAAQMQNRVPRSRRAQFLPQLPEGQGALLKKKDLIDAGVVFQQETAAAMDHARQMRLGKSFPQGLEDDRVGQGVADSGAGEAEDARVRTQFDRPGAGRTASR